MASPPRVIRQGAGKLTKATGRRLPGFDDPQEAFAPFRFVQMADTQLGLNSFFKQLKQNFEKNPPKPDTPDPEGFLAFMRDLQDLNPELSFEAAYAKEMNMCERAVAIINKMEPLPEFCVVCGDLVNAMPTGRGGLGFKTPNGSREQQKEQRADFLRIFSKIDQRVSLVCVCGNHDIGEVPTEETIDFFKADFGDDYFDFWCRNVRFWVLNSQLYHKDWPAGSELRRLADDQDRWLDGKLADDRTATHHVVFTHITPFLVHAEEPEGIQNLARRDRTRVLDKLLAKAGSPGRDHGIDLTWFSGHYHRNLIARYKGAELVITGALGTNFRANENGDPGKITMLGGFELNGERSGMRIVDVTATGLKHEYHGIYWLDAIDKIKDSLGPARL